MGHMRSEGRMRGGTSTFDASDGQNESRAPRRPYSKGSSGITDSARLRAPRAPNKKV